MLKKQDLAVIQVLNQGILRKCTECINNNCSEVNNTEIKVTKAIEICDKSDCGLHSVRYQN